MFEILTFEILTSRKLTMSLVTNNQTLLTSSKFFKSRPNFYKDLSYGKSILLKLFAKFEFGILYGTLTLLISLCLSLLTISSRISPSPLTSLKYSKTQCNQRQLFNKSLIHQKKSFKVHWYTSIFKAGVYSERKEFAPREANLFL